MSCASSATRARASTSRAERARVYESAPINAAVTMTSVTPMSTVRVAMKPRPIGTPARDSHARRRSRAMRIAALALAVCAALVSRAAAANVEWPSGWAPTRDPSGEGYRIGDHGLWVAGDATIAATVPEEARPRLELEDLDLLVRYEPTPRVAFFTDVRLEETLLMVGDDFHVGSGDLS